MKHKTVLVNDLNIDEAIYRALAQLAREQGFQMRLAQVIITSHYDSMFVTVLAIPGARLYTPVSMEDEDGRIIR